MSYWDIEDYFLYEEQIGVTTEMNIDGLNKLLDENCSHHHQNTTPENTILKVPLWVGLKLLKCNSVKLNEPIYLSTKFYEQLITDPIIINMKTKNSYFYDICIILLKYLETDYDWLELLWKSAFERYMHLFINSNNEIYENYTLVKKLASREKNLYKALINQRDNSKLYITEYNKINKETNSKKRRLEEK